MKGNARDVRVLKREHPIEIEFDGMKVEAFEGETIASALLASGHKVLRKTSKLAAPRGVFCSMGICFGCLMTVNGIRNVRACVTLVETGMKVETQNESEWQGGH